MSSKSLSIARSLGCLTDRFVLRDACRQLANFLARKLRENALVYRKLSLCVDTENEVIEESICFLGGRAPSSLPFHIDNMVLRLCPSSSVERVTITVSELIGAQFEQEAFLFEGDPSKRDPPKREEIRKLVNEVNRKYRVMFASSLRNDRREMMLSFYDPLRLRAR